MSIRTVASRVTLVVAVGIAPVLAACSTDAPSEGPTATAASPLRIQPLDATEKSKLQTHTREAMPARTLVFDKGGKLPERTPKLMAVPLAEGHDIVFATLDERGVSDVRVVSPHDGTGQKGVTTKNFDPGTGGGSACDWGGCSYWQSEVTYWRGEWLAAVGSFNGSELYYGLRWYEAEKAAVNACAGCP